MSGKPQPDFGTQPDIHNSIDGFIAWISVEKGLSDNTLDAYSHDLRDFSFFLEGAGILELSGVSPSVIASHLRGLTDIGLGAKSLARRMSSIRGLYKYLLSEGLLKKDPTEGLDLPKLP